MSPKLPRNRCVYPDRADACQQEAPPYSQLSIPERLELFEQWPELERLRIKPQSRRQRPPCQALGRACTEVAARRRRSHALCLWKVCVLPQDAMCHSATGPCQTCNMSQRYQHALLEPWRSRANTCARR